MYPEYSKKTGEGMTNWPKTVNRVSSPFKTRRMSHALPAAVSQHSTKTGLDS